MGTLEGLASTEERWARLVAERDALLAATLHDEGAELARAIAERRAQLDALGARAAELASAQRSLQERVRRLTGIEGTRDYRQAGQIEHEEELLSEKLAEVEEAELEVLEQTEGIEAELTTLEGDLAEVRAVQAEAEEARSSKLAELDSELRQLEAELDELLAGLPDALAARIRAGRSSRQRRGTAFVRRGVCSSCHLAVPDHLVAAARHGEGAASCEECGAVLVVGEGDL
jgi:predicted  nucleic acid-binding Zn-ribbon protein